MTFERKRVALSGGVALISVTAVIALMLIRFPAYAKAEQPPRDGCVAVSKVEYDSAKKQYLLSSNNGVYVRSGRFLRRSYWYCLKY
jgi:hypothetical protein